MISRVVSLAAALVTLSGVGAAQDSLLVRALKTNALEMRLVGGALQGKGADALAREARENQFLLVGEDHGIREVPEFIGGLFDLARPAGYSHLAVEVGPITTRMLETMMRPPTAQRDLDAFLARYTPFTIPFFFWQEEAEMLEHVVKSAPGKDAVLWGLDQEFMASPTYLFQKLAQLAPTESGRALAARFAVSSDAGDKALISAGNPSKLWMVASADSDVARLRSTFGARAPAAARAIIDEISVSRDIYRRFGSGAGYDSNQQRDDLMKRHFVDHYRAAQARGEAKPKVIVKLGANHIFRGPSITATYEIGSFVPEFAAAEGGRSFGILLVVKRGTSNAYRPFGSPESDKTKPYDLLSSAEYKVLDLRSLLAASDDSAWTFIDLRPARRLSSNGGLKDLSAPARRLLTSFDAVVVVPEGHASVYIR